MALSHDDIHQLPRDEEEMLRRAVDFHGHLGPYVLFGLRAGLLARRLLDADCHFDLRVVAWVGTKPSPSCMADGLQVATGATLGKGTIELRPLDDEGPRALISARSRSVLIRPSREALEAIRGLAGMAAAHDRGNELMAWPDERLLTVEEVTP